MTINFEAKTDRDLLVMTAQTCNEMNEHLTNLDGQFLKHEQRLVKLETKASFYNNPIIDNPIIDNPSLRERAMNTIGKSGVFVIIGSLGGGVIYALGSGIGWW